MKARHQNLPPPVQRVCLRFLNMQIQTSHSTLNIGLTVDLLVSELEERFPLTNPGPADQLNPILYPAGQRSVVDWINSRITNEEL